MSVSDLPLIHRLILRKELALAKFGRCLSSRLCEDEIAELLT